MSVTIITAFLTSSVTIGIYEFFLKELIKNKFNKDIIGHKEKLELYKIAIGPFTRFLGKLSRHTGGIDNNELTIDDLNTLDDLRLELHGLLGLFANKNVMDAYDNQCDGLADYIKKMNEHELDTDEKRHLAWKEYTGLALKWVSAMRKDIGLQKDDVTYTGKY